MKVRIKFVKSGSMRFLGHLDVMRFFQKAIRRCEADIMYSGGYSPHQLISFASPLGLGLTSEGEYMDAQLASYEEPEKLVGRLNLAMNDEFLVTDAVYVPDTAHPTMSRVAASDYLLSAKKQTVSDLFKDTEEFARKFREFLSQDSIIIQKKTKKNTASIDIKPFIYLVQIQKEKEMDVIFNQVKKQPPMPEAKHAFTVETEYPELSKDTLFQVPHIFIRVSCGSVVNLKPEQVLEAFYAFCGFSFEKLDWNIHRIELYADEYENTKEPLEHRIRRAKKFVTLLEDEK